MKRIIPLAILCFGFAACSQTDMQLENPENNLSEVFNKTRENSDTKVSFSLAEKVARSTRPGTRANDNIKDIRPICLDSGDPVVYAVNFSNFGGFVLVSASQNYTPVLAEVEKGSFDILNLPENVKYYLEGYKYAIESYNEAPEDSVKKYRKLWKRYLDEEPIKKQTRSSSPELDTFIYDSQRKWNGSSYDWTSLAENRLGLDFFDDFVIEFTDSHPDADLSTIFIVALPTTITTFVDNFITSEWGQEAPYNSLVPNNYPAGCVPVAMGQIMRYHKKPAGYNWEGMADYYSFYDSAPEVARLLKDIGTKVKISYTPDGSGAKISDAQKAFKSYGYSDAKIIDHNIFTVENNLCQKLAVYGRGENPSTGKGHAWVYSGFDYKEDIFYYTLLVPVEDPTSSSYFKYKWEETELEKEMAGYMVSKRKLYINWGYYGLYNGWYSDHDISYTGSGGNKVIYSQNRKDIINIK